MNFKWLQSQLAVLPIAITVAACGPLIPTLTPEEKKETPSPTPTATATPTPSAPNSWVMSSPNDESRSNDTTPLITGNGATPGDTIKIFDSNDCSGTALSDAEVQGDGTFSISAFTLTTEKLYEFYFTAENDGGKTTCANTDLSYTLDTTTPSAVSSFSMSSPNDNSYSSDQTPVLSGSGAEALATIKIYSDASCSGTVHGTGTVTLAGTFTISAFTLTTEKAYDFYYTITDVAGNIRTCASTSLNYTLDRTAPSVTITSPLPNIFSTVNQSMSFSASDSVGVTEQCVSSNSECSGCTWEPFTGTKNFTFSTPWEKKLGTVKVRDAAGNTSNCVTSEGYYETLTLTSKIGSGAAARAWHQWYKSDGSGVCSGAESISNGDKLSCVHSASLVKIAYPDATQCQNLKMTDKIELFDWACYEDVGNSQVIFNGTLKPNRGLRDLIMMDTAPYWRSLSVTLYDGNTPIAGRANRPFWDSALTLLTVGSTSISAPGTYVVNQDVNVPGMTITSKNVALVYLQDVESVKNGASNNCTISGVDQDCVVDIKAGSNFVYIEGNFGAKGFNFPYGINAEDSKWILLNNLNMTTNIGTAIRFKGVSDAFVMGSRLGFNDRGILIDNGNGVRISSSIIYQSNTGIEDLNSSNTSITQSLVVKNATGINAKSPINISGLTLDQNTDAMRISDNAHYSHLLNILSSDDSSLFLELTSNNTTVDHIAFNSILHTKETAEHTKFMGYLFESSNGANCVSNLPNSGITHGSCIGNDQSDIEQLKLDANLVRSSVFQGILVPSEENVNAHTYPISQSLIEDYFDFKNLFRFISCSGGTCDLYGLGFKAPGIDPYLVISQGETFETSDSCTDFFRTDQMHTALSSKSYHHRLLELMGDGVGNDDGFCERQEDCMIAPHFGAFQGSGTRSACQNIPTDPDAPYNVIGWTSPD